MTTGVSVFGLGYVGCVSAACFAEQGFQVVGVDVSEAKVSLINSGKATIVEAGIQELVASMVGAGRLRATTSAEEAVGGTDISLVCVGTPSRPNGSLDLEYVKRVCGEIGQAIAKKGRWHLVVIRSTVLPGTLQDLVTPVLEAASGGRVGEHFGLCSNPEFLREGTSIKDFAEPPFTLIGASDERAATALRMLYAGINAPTHVTPIRVAEAVKYVCNCFHGLKVSFANEIGNLCKAMDIDSHEVMRLVCEDRKLNISPAYLRPGFAFGGSCLPKDLRALVYRGKQLDIDTPLLGAVLQSNKQQVERGVAMVLASGARRVGILGIAFKAGTDDLRESPTVTLIEQLLGKGIELSIYDRDVRSANVIGANREYVERGIPHIWSLMRESVEEVVAASDAIVIGNGSAEFRDLDTRLRDGQVVIDLVRAFGPRRSDGTRYEGISW
jgi:GDP-mannose 6-dehydrogenase